MAINDWELVMSSIRLEAEEAGVEWYQVRNATINRLVAEDPEFYEGNGIGSSDGNHMLYGEWKHNRTQVRRDIEALAEGNRMRAYLQEAGVDLELAAQLFAPL